MNAKRIQTLMGHSSITLTYDRFSYGFKMTLPIKGLPRKSSFVCWKSEACRITAAWLT
jgi:hypothetical protein